MTKLFKSKFINQNVLQSKFNWLRCLYIDPKSTLQSVCKGFMNTEFKIAALFEGRQCASITKEGIEGVKRKNPYRPISLISLEARQSVDRATIRGLCYEKFTADIIVECDQMPDTDTRIQSGDVVLEILPERKRCWPECVLLERELPCPLIEGVRYARVVKTGEICLGGTFILTDDHNHLDSE